MTLWRLLDILGHFVVGALLAALLYVAVALSQGCATYSDPIPGVRYPASPAKIHVNSCDRSRLPEAVEVVVAVREAARDLGLLVSWPPAEPLVLCVVSDHRGAVCLGGGRALAGCTSADGRRVIVSTHWSPSADWMLVEHDWRATLIHEVVAALAIQGSIAIPAPEARTEHTWVAREDYRRLTAAARARL